MSFSSARALWARADERRRWIGDDHGDPYETALLCQNVPLEMQIALKELLEHLRSALDYAARAICAGCGALTGREKIYFPIARPSAREADFAALVGRTPLRLFRRHIGGRAEQHPRLGPQRWRRDCR